MKPRRAGLLVAAATAFGLILLIVRCSEPAVPNPAVAKADREPVRTLPGREPVVTPRSAVPADIQAADVPDVTASSTEGVTVEPSFQPLITANEVISEELASVTNDALRNLWEHRQILGRSEVHARLVFSVLPEFSRLVAEGAIHVQVHAEGSHVFAPLCTFSLNLDQPLLYLNIHSQTLNASYEIPRSVGSERLWSAVLARYEDPRLQRR